MASRRIASPRLASLLFYSRLDMAAASSDKSVKKFRWKNVSTVSELGDNMIRYLRGELPTSPWAGAPVDPETVGILDPLIRVNKLGYITSSGQPGSFKFPVPIS